MYFLTRDLHHGLIFSPNHIMVKKDHEFAKTSNIFITSMQLTGCFSFCAKYSGGFLP